MSWSEVFAVLVVSHVVGDFVVDDGRLLSLHMRRVKRSDQGPGELVFVSVDQSIHLLALFGTSLLAVV